MVTSLLPVSAATTCDDIPLNHIYLPVDVNPMWTISQYLLSLNSGMFRQVNASTLRKDIRSGHTKISFTGRTSGEAVTLLRAGHLGKTFKKLRLSDHATFAFVGGLKGGVTASLDNAVAGPSSGNNDSCYCPILFSVFLARTDSVYFILSFE